MPHETQDIFSVLVGNPVGEIAIFERKVERHILNRLSVKRYDAPYWNQIRSSAKWIPSPHAIEQREQRRPQHPGNQQRSQAESHRE